MSLPYNKAFRLHGLTEDTEAHHQFILLIIGELFSALNADTLPFGLIWI